MGIVKRCLHLCPSDLGNTKATSKALQVQMRSSLDAWLFCEMFYFLEYAIRSRPAVMIPEFAR